MISEPWSNLCLAQADNPGLGFLSASLAIMTCDFYHNRFSTGLRVSDICEPEKARLLCCVTGVGVERGLIGGGGWGCFTVFVAWGFQIFASPIASEKARLLYSTGVGDRSVG